MVTVAYGTQTPFVSLHKHHQMSPQEGKSCIYHFWLADIGSRLTTKLVLTSLYFYEKPVIHEVFTELRAFSTSILFQDGCGIHCENVQHVRESCDTTFGSTRKFPEWRKHSTNDSHRTDIFPESHGSSYRLAAIETWRIFDESI